MAAANRTIGSVVCRRQADSRRGPGYAFLNGRPLLIALCALKIERSCHRKGESMKRCTWSSLASVLVFLSACGASAQTVKTVRVVVPEQGSAVLRNIADVLARQVA